MTTVYGQLFLIDDFCFEGKPSGYSDVSFTQCVNGKKVICNEGVPIVRSFSHPMCISGPLYDEDVILSDTCSDPTEGHKYHCESELPTQKCYIAYYSSDACDSIAPEKVSGLDNNGECIFDGETNNRVLSDGNYVTFSSCDSDAQIVLPVGVCSANGSDNVTIICPGLAEGPGEDYVLSSVEVATSSIYLEYEKTNICKNGSIQTCKNAILTNITYADDECETLLEVKMSSLGECPGDGLCVRCSDSVDDDIGKLCHDYIETFYSDNQCENLTDAQPHKIYISDSCYEWNGDSYSFTVEESQFKLTTYSDSLCSGSTEVVSEGELGACYQRHLEFYSKIQPRSQLDCKPDEDTENDSASTTTFRNVLIYLTLLGLVICA